MNKQYVIIGTSAAGIGAARRLRILDPNSSILCISQESELPYNKCLLTDYALDKKKLNQITIFDKNAAEKCTISLRPNTEIVSINPLRKVVVSKQGQEFWYSKLCIATGSSPKIPTVNGLGTQTKGFFTFHTLNDVNRILSFCSKNNASRAIVLGAGLSGLECADVLHQKGLKVTLIDMQEHILPFQADTEGALYLQGQIIKTGLRLCLNTCVKEIISVQNRICAVILQDDTRILTDFIVSTIGVKPNSSIAADAGIRLDNGYIWTNETMQTSDDDIYAAGDVTMVYDNITGIRCPTSYWPDAMKQGIVAADNMFGNTQRYHGVFKSANSSFFGLNFDSSGIITDNVIGDYHVLINTEDGYQKIVIDKSGIVKGYLIIGKTMLSSALKKQIITQQPVELFR